MLTTKKGNFGYIKSGRFRETLKTVGMLAISVSLYYAGILQTGSNKNVLTYVAILGVLPAAKFMVNAVLFYKAKGCSDGLKIKLDEVGLTPTFYDMFFTSYKKNFQISALFYKKGTLIGVTEDEKCEVSEGEKHLSEALSKAGFEVTVKIFTDEAKFISRMKELSLLEDEGDTGFLFDNIKSLAI